MQPPLIAGVDEAGRGCLAGPVVAGAVILPSTFPTALLKDSKILSAKKRRLAFDWITRHCCHGVGVASHAEIDSLGIKRATELAMQRAVARLAQIPELLHIDGRDGFRFSLPSKQFVRGDSLFPEIAAASIVAKVSRDEMMREYSSQFPDFGFAEHKGYGVQMHRTLIAQRRFTAIHRLSFEPLKSVLSEQTRLASPQMRGD